MRYLLPIFFACFLLHCGKPPSVSPHAPLLESGVESVGKIFRATISWVAHPKARQYATARVQITLPIASVTSLDAIIFDPQMPTHGHGTFVDDQKVTVDPPNTIQVENVFFAMGGPWVVHVTATVNGKTDTVLLPVDVP